MPARVRRRGADVAPLDRTRVGTTDNSERPQAHTGVVVAGGRQMGWVRCRIGFAGHDKQR